MKLIMENWRGYLTEEEMHSQIMAYLEENNITLTEEEIEEAMPRWMKKLGTGMALAGALSGVGQKADAGPLGDFFKNRSPEAAQQQQAPEEGPSEDGNSFTAKAKLGHDMQMAMDAAALNAKAGLVKQGDITDVQTKDISISYDSFGGYIYATATVN
tara:strand:+ start:905 stop:1375 length:471 start_codon:yes stop_codon:yes gene_type:complete